MNDFRKHIAVIKILLLVFVSNFTLPAYSQSHNNTDNFSSPDAQPDSLTRFEQITVEDGISDNRINGFLHDSEGYMWFGSMDGLNRYNGYEFTTYWHDPADSSSLSGNYIEALFEDRTNTMWVGTWGFGLNRYDRESETFERFRHDPGDPTSLVHDNVAAIAEDGNGQLWVGTPNGLSRWEESTNTFKTYQHDPEDESSLSHNIIRSMLVDRSGVLWIGTGSNFTSPVNEGGLNRYNPETDSFIRYPGNTAGLVGYHVVALHEDTSGTLWVGTAAGGLHRMDREQGTFTSVAPALRDQGYLTFIFSDSDGRFWVGTESGLNLVKRSTGSFTFFAENNSKPDGLSESRVWRMYEDRTGGLWIGCGSIGCLEKVKTELEPFRYYGAANTNDGTAWQGIYTIAPIQDGTLLVGTDTGIFKLDQAISLIERYNPASVDLPNFPIETIHQDQQGVIWAGGYDGLFAFNPASGQVNDFLAQVADPEKSYNYIYTIYEDAESTLWVGGNMGLFRFDREEQLFIREAEEVTTASSDSFVHSILNDDDEGTIWLGTTWNIYQLDLQADEAIHILDVDRPHAFLRDTSGIVWTATNGGLIQMDPLSGNSTIYTRQDGLPSNTIKDIIEPTPGDLWMATLNGISRFDPSRKTFQNYDARDGLGSVAFLDVAVNQRGRLFFAGPNGVAEYIGGQNTVNKTPPKVHITSITASGHPIDADQTDLTLPLKLQHNENDLVISFVGLHYKNPSRNQYQTKLEPLEESWIDPGIDRQVRYVNLDPGNYVFRVRSANSDGVWNEEGASLHVTILPPWWRTWWAYGLYGLLLISGILAADRIQRKRLIAKERERARERELEQEKAHARQLEEAYSELEYSLKKLTAAQDQLVQQEKLASLGQLTAGIAHEIKNPLNFVNNFSDLSIELVEEAREELSALSRQLSEDTETSPLEGSAEAERRRGVSDETRNHNLILEILDDIEMNLKKIHEHGTRADNIVKSMLQHSRGGSGKVEPTDINALINEYVNLAFHGMRASKNPINVDIELDLDENAKEIPLIAEDFSRVILNLCNNAFDAMREKLNKIDNHSEKSDIYLPKLKVSTRQEDGQLRIEIQDNGPGIPAELREKILQPFFTTKKGKDGTGLGLSITNDIVKSHGGNIIIQSESGNYTRFSITIPYQNR